MRTPSLHNGRADHRRGVSKSETTGQATRRIVRGVAFAIAGVRELGLIFALLGTLSNMQCDLTHE
jgi:hypothetical protein